MRIDFKQKQAEFAAYIRNPAVAPAPQDVAPERLAMYRELFFNNVDSFLCSNFPVLRAILSDGQWQALAEDFFARHSCRTPHFSEIAEEFLDYLQNERDSAADLPFLLELAHYEWVEMALSIARDAPDFGDPQFIENLLKHRLALSPVAWPLVYQYPVERIGPDYLPQDPLVDPSYLIVYRDRTDHVHFMQTTPYTYRLLQIIEQTSGRSGQEYLQALAAELPEQADQQSLLQMALKVLQELVGRDILIPAPAV